MGVNGNGSLRIGGTVADGKLNELFHDAALKVRMALSKLYVPFGRPRRVVVAGWVLALPDAILEGRFGVAVHAVMAVVVAGIVKINRPWREKPKRTDPMFGAVMIAVAIPVTVWSAVTVLTGDVARGMISLVAMLGSCGEALVLFEQELPLPPPKPVKALKRRYQPAGASL